jgi:hypothetical protein
VGNTKETHTSFSFSFNITFHASEFKKDLAQSNLVGFRSEETKKSYQTTGTGVLGELLSGAKNFAHSLIPYAGLFLARGSCSDKDMKLGSISRFSGNKTIPTCKYPVSPIALSPDVA